MNDQSSSPDANVNPTDGQQSNALNKEDWVIENLAYTEDLPAKGFLQLCADRRFHKCIQRAFKEDAGLTSRDDYWIHADAGGTPKMEGQRITPDYCYINKEVRLMGWSAHGAGCGGFGEEVPDEVIQRELCNTMQRNVRKYSLATHFIYFATVRNEETVLYRMKAEPGEDIVCTQGSD
ncbi:MAG TPA: hypothetical protein VIW80_06490 [Pyrinomonadaceae bacterium]|jgi:hypothetical protein